MHLYNNNAKHITLKPFKDRKATIAAVTLSSHNLPTDRAGELFKSSADSNPLRKSSNLDFFKILSFSVMVFCG